MSEKGSHICPVWLSFMLSNSIRKWLDPPSRVLDRLGVRADDVVIDFGCGPGFYTIPLARMTGRVIAIDSQTGMLEKASRYQERTT